jgi:hypothetical protein
MEFTWPRMATDVRNLITQAIEKRGTVAAGATEHAPG